MLVYLLDLLQLTALFSPGGAHTPVPGLTYRLAAADNRGGASDRATA